jgi:hypothetical protein
VSNDILRPLAVTGCDILPGDNLERSAVPSGR